ncbi:MAG: response regulator [Candidatus Levyibacteriota bacterium]
MLHPTSSKNKPIIVVADDDPAILEAMRMVLELYNFKVETIADGVVVPKLRKLRPQLLFLDIRMSGADGRTICKKLKTEADTKHIPVVMISANTNLRHCMEEAGANDYLAKPFDMNDLLTKVEKYLPN